MTCNKKVLRQFRIHPSHLLMLNSDPRRPPDGGGLFSQTKQPENMLPSHGPGLPVHLSADSRNKEISVTLFRPLLVLFLSLFCIPSAWADTRVELWFTGDTYGQVESVKG